MSTDATTAEGSTGRPDVELVVLVDEAGRQIGTAPKATVHGRRTPLHRAFSCYLFDPDGRLLLTRRAVAKPTFPGMWTNSVCGHPAPGESDAAAVGRRARLELGLQVTDLTVALPGFRYRAEYAGVVENEICPVYLGRTGDVSAVNPDEVDDYRWTGWPAFLGELGGAAERFSPWCREQAQQLHAGGHVAAYLG